MPLPKEFTFWVCFFFFGLVLAVHAAEETFSPRSTFKITQHYDGDWSSVLHFTKGDHSDVTLTDEYLWPAGFYVSPDDQWILQIQKSGSGDNVSFLYRLESSGRLWRMEQQFGELAFAFLQRSLKVRVKDLYHTGIEFESWNQKDKVLRFRIRGTFVNESGKGINRELVYDLTKHDFRIP